MQEFIAERNNGTTTTTAVDQALMKTFKDASAIDLAIQAGIVNEGEIVSTIEDDQPHLLPIDQLRDLQEDVRKLQEEQGSIEELIPEDASTSDLLATIGQVLTAIQSLDVASIGGNGKYIKAIEETNGKISATEETFDTAVTQNSTKGVSSGAVYTAIAAASSGSASSLASEVTARQNADTALDNRLKSTVTSSDKAIPESEIDTKISNAVNALDAASAGGNGKYIKAIEETDGVIAATEGTVDTIVTASSDNLITSGAVNSALAASETALQGNINAVNAKISITASASDKVPAMSEVTSAITNAINGLDVSASGGTGKFIKAISQTDGKISATEGTLSMTLSGNDLYITFA